MCHFRTLGIGWRSEAAAWFRFQGVAAAMPVQFAVLASGSRGNATLVQAGGAGILLDLGLGPRALAQRLESVGWEWRRIAAALLTHTHGDHFDNATLHRLAKYRVTLYCHEGHRAELAHHTGFQALGCAGLVRDYDERPFLAPTGMRIEPVALRHDGGPTFGFRLEVKPARAARPVALGYLADTGSWSDDMAEMLADVDLLGVEFNHDVAMQLESRRPPALIARNLGDWGHLSNAQGAAFVAAVLARSRPGAVRHLVLLHLSQQCNRPKLALGAARQAVRAAERRVTVLAARQDPAHPNIWVRAGRTRAAPRAQHRPTPAAAAEGNDAGALRLNLPEAGE
jgi:phosphoribosyl 1,2-cyclic phosphodiesterase